MKINSSIIRLFSYESGYGQRGSILWDNPDYFSHPGGQSGKILDEEYEN